MSRAPSFVKRLIIAGLTAGVLATAALGATTAGADPIPARAPVAAAPATTLFLPEVRPGGTYVDALALSSEPTSLTYSLKRADMAPPVTGGAGPLQGVRAPIGGGVLSPPESTPVYETKHPLHLTGLTSNTTYVLYVAATTRSGQRLTAQAQFTTLKERVRLTLDKIVIHDDGDTFSDGDPTWFWQVGWATGTAKDCYPKSAGQCKEGDFSEGTVYPVINGQKFAFVFAEENFQPVPNPHPQPGNEDFTSMPQQFQLKVSAKESDYAILGGLDSLFDWGAWLGGIAQASWQVPQGKESASQQVTVSAEDGNFRSTMYFTFQLFHDNQSYPPNDGRVFSTAK